MVHGVEPGNLVGVVCAAGARCIRDFDLQLNGLVAGNDVIRQLPHAASLLLASFNAFRFTSVAASISTLTARPSKSMATTTCIWPRVRYTTPLTPASGPESIKT